MLVLLVLVFIKDLSVPGRNRNPISQQALGRYFQVLNFSSPTKLKAWLSWLLWLGWMLDVGGGAKLPHKLLVNKCPVQLAVAQEGQGAALQLFTSLVSLVSLMVRYPRYVVI